MDEREPLIGQELKQEELPAPMLTPGQAAEYLGYVVGMLLPEISKE